MELFVGGRLRSEKLLPHRLLSLIVFLLVYSAPLSTPAVGIVFISEQHLDVKSIHAQPRRLPENRLIYCGRDIFVIFYAI